MGILDVFRKNDKKMHASTATNADRKYPADWPGELKMAQAIG